MIVNAIRFKYNKRKTCQNKKERGRKNGKYMGIERSDSWKGEAMRKLKLQDLF